MSYSKPGYPTIYPFVSPDVLRGHTGKFVALTLRDVPNQDIRAFIHLVTPTTAQGDASVFYIDWNGSPFLTAIGSNDVITVRPI